MKKQCKSKAKTTGQRCENPPMKGLAVCRMHGGKSPKGKESPSFKHGLYSQYPGAIGSVGLKDHMDAAASQDAIATLRQTIPLVAAILSSWVEKGLAFLPKEAAATTAMLQRLTKMVDTYEKLTNPELRTGKLVVEYDYKDKSDGDLLDEIAELHKEAQAITRSAAERETQA